MKKILLLVLSIYSTLAIAQPGRLITTFNPSDHGYNGDGRGAYSLTSGISNFLVLPDDKILALYLGEYNGTVIPGLMRVEADGALDNTFTPIATDIDDNKFLLQSDGKILIYGQIASYASSSVNNKCIRISPNGNRDTGFSISGYTISKIYSIIQQTNGKLVMIADCYDSGSGQYIKKIIRINTDGSADTGFTEYNLTTSFTYWISVQADDKIIVSGTEYAASGDLFRLTANGTLDNTFANNFATSDIYFASAVQSNGKILVLNAGSGLLRYNSDGTLDNTFNANVNFYDCIIKVLPNDKILLVKSSYGMLKLNSDGTVDNSFVIYTGAMQGLTNFDTQSDGKIITNLGWDEIENNRKGFVRYHSNGKFDPTFDYHPGVNDQIYTMTELADKRIILTGYFDRYNDTIVPKAVCTYPNGAIDIAFQSNLPSFINYITQAIAQPDGKIIMSIVDMSNVSRVIRLNSDGTHDSSFNSTLTDGRIFALRLDGKIYVATNTIGVVLLNSNGTIDNSFNSGSGVSGGIIKNLLVKDDNSIIVCGYFTGYNGTSVEGLVHLNTDGTIQNTYPNLNLTSVEYEKIKFSADGGIIAAGSFADSVGNYLNIFKITPQGRMDNKFTNFVTGTYPFPTTMEVLASGAIIAGEEVLGLVLLNENGTPNTDFNLGSGFSFGGLLDFSLSQNVLGKIYSVVQLANGSLLVGGNFTSYNGVKKVSLINMEAEKGVFGYTYQDINHDCTWDAGETVVEGRKYVINPGNYIVETNARGFWNITGLPSGNYTVTADTTGKWKTVCSVAQNFTITNPDSLQIIPAIGFYYTNPCPIPVVSVSMPLIKPCFSNLKLHVQASNQNTATAPIMNGYVDLQLDPLLIAQSATRSYTTVGANKYRFMLSDDTLNPGMNDYITVTCSLSCTAILGQTLCIKANINPLDSCALDTIPAIITGVATCTGSWDESHLEVKGRCETNNVKFTVRNTGIGNMQCYAPVRKYVDGILSSIDSVMIASGDSAEYTISGDARTWRLETEQHPLHPGNSQPNATIENCGTGTWTTGLVNALPMDDADPGVDIFCGVVVASYDPNDKRGYPMGVGATHDIIPNRKLEYMIRFQNTGTAAAENVVIRDTLDTDLDIFSMKPGTASHNYTFKMYGPRVLEWTFSNIQLPDSNANEPASHGFITYTVNQNRNLPNGTLITNNAGIYFDFNAPVITNTTVHTVNEAVQTVVTGLTKSKEVAVGKMMIYPNPANNQITVYSSETKTIEIYNMLGVAVKVLVPTVSEGYTKTTLDISELPKGMYVVKAETESVKLIKD